MLFFFLSAGTEAQAQIQNKEIEKVEIKLNRRKAKKIGSKKLSGKHLKNKIGYHQKKADPYKIEQKKSNDKNESIVIYERSYSVKYGVYLFMNTDKNDFSETLALRGL
ncbi:hypothetical protein FW781_06230 (plasmid) [Chryseobacterium panacisoli]|uniref:Uncharacterized protein n=1 Tax=Chryseobacterium panacisoli TaxID=1807141 RepID=A0A5D8ZZF0_9FLAO|nr:hypothetical protein [Chryseobacterium panacisoli]TZF99522.1 hypothetical protein FW781_06230 [Chryseobacterium panacisoli]